MSDCHEEDESDYLDDKFGYVCTQACGRAGVPRRLDAFYPCWRAAIHCTPTDWSTT
ncbi:hypothetical protein G4G28_24185 [Massilia sp. Dwa41.01b]|uniref:hypothetical protein n=1 Tax=unclassified Massilia TaxID=2609279 RepID=UPI001600EF44|nr:MULTISPECIES: hypothetical protein [unclassified Massilia]QNA90825.1 hypothetical protein G4G28_24185 [Massilia sp. Dwa41.01b]QNA98069.1 hypothetical protein G4G31_03285 [Massilia sp. Se16.2.3]